MEKSLINEITKKGLDTYYKARTFEAMYWPLFFPLKNVLSLDVTTLIGEQGGRVAADVIAFDASAPLKTRQVVAKMKVDIPKIAMKRKMSEKDILEYRILSSMADGNEKQILDLIYDDLDFVVQSANARLEWLALTAISQTKITLSSTNNNGRVTEEAIDFQMPAANKFGATVAWSSANKLTMKPVTDMKDISKAALSKGQILKYQLMDKTTFDIVTASTEMQEFVKTYGQITASGVTPFLSLDYVNAALNAADLPQIRVINQSIGIEGKNGVITKSNPWNTSYVTFVTETTLGSMLNGPIAEELMPPKNVVQSKSGNVLVTKYSSVDPVAEFTKSEANSFPAWKTISECYSLKRDATSWS